MVMAQSLFMTLKQQQPDTPIDVLAPAWSKPLLQRMPQVSEAIEMPLTHGEFAFARRRALGHSLRGRHYSQAIVLPRSWKSALVPFFASIPRRTGYHGEQRFILLNDRRALDKQALPMTVQRFNALAGDGQPLNPPPVPQPELQINAQGVEAALQAQGLNRDKPVMVMCPGAEYGPAKRWPAQHFAAVASHYLVQGWQVWLMGSEKDQAVTAEINRLTNTACVDLAGKTALGEAIDLMSLADTVVSNDSGLMHVAASLGRNLIVLYGSSDPGFTPPLSATASIIRLGLDCSPCFKRECPLGHTDCLVKIEPARVIKAIDFGRDCR
jgi:heptosyltransferase-2